LIKPILTKFAAIVVMAAVLASCTKPDSSRLPAPADLHQNLQAIEICEDGIQTVLGYLNENSDRWGLNYDSEQQFIGNEDRQLLLMTWSSMLDYFAQLDYIKQANQAFYYNNGDEIISDDFTAFYLAFLIQYRYALEFLDLIERNQALYQILNEEYIDGGLPPSSYKAFKLHFLDIIIATKFVALNLIDQETAPPRSAALDQKIVTARKYIQKMHGGRRITLSLANSIQRVRDAAFTLWFPMQRGVAKLITGRKVWRHGKDLLSLEDIQEIGQILQPGDIIFMRREWFLTNVGVPGFWTHSAFFIGTPERRKEMTGDEATRNWVVSMGEESGNFESLLKKTYPDQYASSLFAADDGTPKQIIEVRAPGTIFASLVGSFTCDGLSAVRPRLSHRDKAVAIFNSFKFLGRGYDYNFDYLTDSSMVCSEVIVKSYERTDDYPGLKFEMFEMAGHMLISPNNIVQQYDEQKGTPDQQLDFVLFYDGIEKLGKAVRSTEAAFRETWKRPDWHIFTQAEPDVE
jgi:hypothetical protein